MARRRTVVVTGASGFLGSRLVWNRLEARYLLGLRSRFFLFFDLGYIFSRSPQDDVIVRNEQWKPGYGFGVRLESGTGVVGIDYGLGEGDGVFDGKVHVGVVGAF